MLWKKNWSPKGKLTKSFLVTKKYNFVKTVKVLDEKNAVHTSNVEDDICAEFRLLFDQD